MCGENAEVRVSISATSGRKEVKPVEVGSSDDVERVLIASPLGNLHPAAGSVVTKTDHHAINAGTILLEQADTQAVLRNTGIEGKGSFHLNFVHEGRFPRSGIGSGVTSAGDPEGPTGPTPAAIRSTRCTHKMHIRIAKSFGEAELPVAIRSSASGQVLEVPGPGHNLCRDQKPSHARRSLTSRGPSGRLIRHRKSAMTRHRFTVYPE